MATSTLPRWPMQPLLDRLNLTHAEAAVALGYAGKDGIKSALRRGLSDAQSDALAVRLGMHPVEVWGIEWVLAGEAVAS